ncbi:hypothetical protein BGI40_06375 [Snodgrassella communis]|nr:hypothetical protein BGI29_11145 [Snodgrassella communis]PIT25581.1 hypothetical protein BGI38_09580 [Snodgrassella communis]PIT27414.1 hypothetical protein BGI39_08095 [Snodgrassella communis]PIT33740.1 hypothetical protein BGI40_06375 [Snodgrassella communis]
MDGGFSTGNDDVFTLILLDDVKNVLQGHALVAHEVGIAPRAFEIAGSQTDENGRHAGIVAFTL